MVTQSQLGQSRHSVVLESAPASSGEVSSLLPTVTAVAPPPRVPEALPSARSACAGSSTLRDFANSVGLTLCATSGALDEQRQQEPSQGDSDTTLTSAALAMRLKRQQILLRQQAVQLKIQAINLAAKEAVEGLEEDSEYAGWVPAQPPPPLAVRAAPPPIRVIRDANIASAQSSTPAIDDDDTAAGVLRRIRLAAADSAHSSKSRRTSINEAFSPILGGPGSPVEVTHRD